MFKKLALPAIALMTMLVLFTPSQADARVRFGVTVGPAYPYTYAYPYAPYSNYYVAPAPGYYNYGYPYYAPPVYSAPYAGFGFSWGHRRGWEHERHEHFRGHEHGRR